MDLALRRAVPQDTAIAQTLYRRITDHLAETVEYPHWHTENHPTPDEVAASVAAGELHLAVTTAPDEGDPDEGDPDETGPDASAREAIAGAVMLNHQAVDSYDDASWRIEAAREEVLIVHLLGVAPEFLGQGVARFLVEASLRAAREQGCRAVRLDTYVENIPARNLYTRCGFTDLGVHTVRYEGTDLSEFHLFEYVL